MKIAPMLSQNFQPNRDYGITSWLVSEKVDGIRCMVQSGICEKYGTEERVFSRSGKRIPNHYIRSILSLLPDGFDGELAPANSANFQLATSMAMTQQGEPNFCYYIFNYFGDGDADYLALPLHQRLADAKQKLAQAISKHPKLMRYTKILPFQEATLAEALEICDIYCAVGAEGLILTHENAPYVPRRCLPSQAHSLKLKPFSDSEAIIVGFESAIARGKYAIEQGIAGTAKQELGALILHSADFAESFHCGTGFTQAQRIEIWQNQKSYLGKSAKIKYMEASSKLRPRHPVFLGLRVEEDLL